MIQTLLPFVIAGLATGSLYAIAAMGLVLTYKTSGVFNLAHGAQAALGAYIMWELWERHGWPWPLAAAGSLAIVGIVGGLLLERLVVGLADKPAATRIVATVGLLVGIQGLIVARYGDAVISMRYFLPTRVLSFGSTNIRVEQLIVMALAAATAVGLGIFFRSTRLGVAMQGVVDDPVLLSLQGTSPLQVRRSAWMIGSCFAAGSGALLAPTLGLDATLLILLVVQAFGAAAIGRFSSLPLAYVGGLIVGVGQEVLKYVVTTDALIDHVSQQILQPLPSNVPFLVLFGVLVFNRRPLFDSGARIVKRARPRPTPPRRTLVIGAIVGVALTLGIPNLVGTRLPSYMAAVGFVPIFASLHLLTRVSGQVSLCQVTFAAIGSAVAAHLASGGVPFPVAVLLGGLAAVPLGALISIPATRLPVVYLAIATFGFGVLVERLFYSSDLVFGVTGSRRISRPSLATGDRAYFTLLVVISLLCCLAVVAVRRGRLGRLLQALADAPDAVAAHGASSAVVRTMAFCASAFIAGIGGAMIGPITGTASGGIYSFGASLSIVAVLFIAGTRPLVAPFIAAGLYLVAPSYISDPTLVLYVPIAFGVAALVAATGVVGSVLEASARGVRIRARPSTTSPARARVLQPASTAP